MTSMMAGYALARLRFPGRRILFYVFVGSMLLPPVVGIIPLFQLFKDIGWYDTWLPLIVPAWLGGNPLFIFLARQYFLSIPQLDRRGRQGRRRGTPPDLRERHAAPHPTGLDHHVHPGLPDVVERLPQPADLS